MSNVPVVLRHNVCVELIEQEDTTASGLYMPQTRTDDLAKGKVVSVGSGHLLTSGESAPVQVAVEDVVVFQKNNATEVTSGNEKYWVLSESAIICVL